MKKTFIMLVTITVLALSVSACGSKEETKDVTNEATADGTASKSDVSFAFGVAVGSSLKDTGVEIDYKEFLAGIKDIIENDKPKVSIEEAQNTIQVAITAAMQVKADKNKEAETAFFAENGKKAGVTTTTSGLQYEVITLGTGPKPLETDTVRVDYVGTFLDGKEFDSSITSGEPAVFPVAMVIPGWVEGIQLMPVGSKFKFYIPSMLAYGEQGSQGGIEPFKTLVFEVELLSIEPPEAK